MKFHQNVENQTVEKPISHEKNLLKFVILMS